jgi:hypothetical protein
MREFDSHLIAGLYESVAGDDGIEPAMTALHEQLGCIASVILSYDPLMPFATYAVRTGAMDATAQRVYESDFAHLDPAPAAFARLPSGTVTSTDRLFDHEVRRKAVVLQEFLRPRGMEETISGVVAPGGARFAMLAMFRGPDRARFDEADFHAVQHILPHMAMALKLRRAFLRLETRVSAMKGTPPVRAAGQLARLRVTGGFRDHCVASSATALTCPSVSTASGSKASPIHSVSSAWRMCLGSAMALRNSP